MDITRKSRLQRKECEATIERRDGHIAAPNGYKFREYHDNKQSELGLLHLRVAENTVQWCSHRPIACEILQSVVERDLYGTVWFEQASWDRPYYRMAARHKPG